MSKFSLQVQYRGKDTWYWMSRQNFDVLENAQKRARAFFEKDKINTFRIVTDGLSATAIEVWRIEQCNHPDWEHKDVMYHFEGKDPFELKEHKDPNSSFWHGCHPLETIQVEGIKAYP